MTDRLDALLQLSSGGDRICPLPILWDRFWKLLGSPREGVGPPLILAGWAFSSDRDKRERFQAHIKYAADRGLLDEAGRFIRALNTQDWHTCSPGGLDRNYGEAVAEEQRKKDLAVARANEKHGELLQVSDSAAFRRQNLGETLCLLHLMFKSSLDIEVAIQHLRESLDSYRSLGEECEPPLHYDATPCVVTEIQRMRQAKQVELLVLELLACIADPTLQGERPDLGRAEIDEFLEDMFANSEEQ